MPIRTTNPQNPRIYTPGSPFDDYLYSICHQFLIQEKKSDEVAAWVRKEIKKRENLEVKFTRQQVYPMIIRAARQGVIKLKPPLNSELAQLIAVGARVPTESIEVVSATGRAAHDALASQAAELIFRLISELAVNKSSDQNGDSVPIHLGIGSGFTTAKVSKYLGMLLSSKELPKQVEKIVIHALSSGVDESQSHLSPVSQFGHFSDAIPKTEYVGLFTHPLVKSSEYETLETSPGTSKAFAQSKYIEIVISSLGSANDPNSLYRQFKKLDNEKSGNIIGDFHFRPYSDSGPITEREDEDRIVTLFDIPDFVRMSEEKNKYVVVVAAPNSNETTKAVALEPLIMPENEKTLRLWTHLCLDVDTAKELLSLMEKWPQKKNLLEPR